MNIWKKNPNVVAAHFLNLQTVTISRHLVSKLQAQSPAYAFFDYKTIFVSLHEHAKII